MNLPVISAHLCLISHHAAQSSSAMRKSAHDVGEGIHGEDGIANAVAVIEEIIS